VDELGVEALKILISIIVALVGWVFAHKFTSKRDLTNKKLENILNLTMESYKALSLYSSDPGRNDGQLHLVNTLINIQCFGNKEQVDMADTILKSIADPTEFIIGLGDLMTSLRSSYRHDLQLSKIEGNVSVVRRTKR